MKLRHEVTTIHGLCVPDFRKDLGLGCREMLLGVENG